MAMKYFLFALAAVAGFSPALFLSPNLARNLYKKLTTDIDSVKEDIVKVHNDFRRKVIPSARNMLKLNWSIDAEENARTVARYCDEAESDPTERRLKNTFCGENKHSSFYPFPWSHVIELWFNQSKGFVYGEWPSSDDDIATDYYTQMVWASSYLIGCEIASCRKKKKAEYIYVCHYCHEGNEPNTLNMPYKKGPPCGDCINNCETGLCTNPCLYYDEYTNCDEQIKYLGCSFPTVGMFCKASCLCTTEIK